MAQLEQTLILTGGGMRCAWSGGFLCGLYELGIRPKEIIASSGNVGNAVYFATNQPESIRRIWTEHLPGKRFISFFRYKKIIDIDYLVDEVLSSKEPIAFDILKKSGIKVVCPLRETTTGHVFTYSNENISYPVLKAAKAMPFLYGKTVSISDKELSDYPFTPQLLVTYAEKNSKCTVIDTREQNNVVRYLGKKLIDSTPEQVESSVLSIIKPDIKAHLLSRSSETLLATFNSGKAYCLENYSK